MKRLVVLCDMDETLVDLLKPWLKKFHRKTGHKMDIEDINHWDIGRCLPEWTSKEDLYGLLHEPGLFKYAKPLPGGIEYVQRFIKDGHTVVIASSQVGDISAYEKMQWLKRHMPFIPVKNIMLGHMKYLLKGDVLIDDGPHNIMSYRQEWPDAFIASIAMPYNKEVSHLTDVYAESYKDPQAAWYQIYHQVTNYAKNGR